MVPTGSALLGLLGLDWLVVRATRQDDRHQVLHTGSAQSGLLVSDRLIVSAIRRSSVLRVPWQAVSFFLVAASLLGSSGAVLPLNL